MPPVSGFVLCTKRCGYENRPVPCNCHESDVSLPTLHSDGFRVVNPSEGAVTQLGKFLHSRKKHPSCCHPVSILFLSDLSQASCFQNCHIFCLRGQRWVVTVVAMGCRVFTFAEVIFETPAANQTFLPMEREKLEGAKASGLLPPPPASVMEPKQAPYGGSVSHIAALLVACTAEGNPAASRCDVPLHAPHLPSPPAPSA